MSEEERLDLEKLASERNMTGEELKKYREYSSRSLNGEEWIEYLKLCEKVFKKTTKYLYIYDHEIKQINNYITKLQQENQRLLELCMYALISSTKIYNHELDDDTKQAFMKIVKENLNDDTYTLRNKIEKHWNGDKQ